MIYHDFRVAGEWILRCGGGVKFTKIDRYIWDYNSLPEWSRNKYEVEGIDAKNTYITDGGLDHLGTFKNASLFLLTTRLGSYSKKWLILIFI